jgi:hypothetical protein
MKAVVTGVMETSTTVPPPRHDGAGRYINEQLKKLKTSFEYSLFLSAHSPPQM